MSTALPTDAVWTPLPWLSQIQTPQPRFPYLVLAEISSVLHQCLNSTTHKPTLKSINVFKFQAGISIKFLVCTAIKNIQTLEN